MRKLSQFPYPWYRAAAVAICYPMLRGQGPVSRMPVRMMAFADTWGCEFCKEADACGPTRCQDLGVGSGSVRQIFPSFSREIRTDRFPISTVLDN